MKLTLQVQPCFVELPSWLCELLGHGVHAVLPSDSLKVFDGQFEHEPGSPVVPAGQISFAAHVPPSAPVKPGLHRHSVTVLLAVGDAEFAGQSSHTGAPAEYLPASHGTHVDRDVAALADEDVPAPQLVHSPSPCASLYVPGLQLAHVPLSCVKPALHVHSDCPGWELYALAGQDKQLPTPISGLYVPIGHCVQEPEDPVQPAAHMSEQSLCESLPADDVCPEGQ